MPDQADGNRSEVFRCLEGLSHLDGWLRLAMVFGSIGAAAPQGFMLLMMRGERNRYDVHVKTLLSVRNDEPEQPGCISVKNRYYGSVISSSRLDLCIGVAAGTRFASTYRQPGDDSQRHPCYRKQLPPDLSPCALKFTVID